MNDRQIDELFTTTVAVDAALLDRVSSSISTSIIPVRPMLPAWVLAAGLTLLSAIVAVLSASLIGFYGLRKLSAMQCGVIFALLAVVVVLLSLASAGSMAPGSRQWMNPFLLVGVAIAAWIATAALLFADHGMGRFVPQGVGCLVAGLAAAIPCGAGAWLILNRGFAVNPSTAGMIAGSLAGTAGLVALEMHCPIFHAPHILVWHTAVVPTAGIAGWLAGRLREHLRQA